jgi:hypothetical protein
MAQKVNVQLVDDLDGSTAESTVEFGLDGVHYAIDLSADNAAQLRDAVATYIAMPSAPAGGNAVVAGPATPLARRVLTGSGPRRFGNGRGNKAWTSPTAAGSPPRSCRPTTTHTEHPMLNVWSAARESAG